MMRDNLATPPSALVLGGTGFVGRPVCALLAQAGWRVTVPTRRLAQATAILHLPNVTVLEARIADDAQLQALARGHQLVVNLVAILHGSRDAFDAVHVALPRRLAAACAAAGVRQLLHVSALGADARRPEAAPSMYLRSKSLGEQALLLAAQGGAFSLGLLRPSVIFGAQDKFLNLFARLQEIAPVVPLAGAHARFQPVWVDDVAGALVRLAARHGSDAKAPRILQACGPKVYTLAELVHLAGCLHGVRGGRGRPILPLPDLLARVQAFLMELAPGEPLMSRDNLDSMKTDNVAQPGVPGLESLGITPAALEPIARVYLAPRPRRLSI